MNRKASSVALAALVILALVYTVAQVAVSVSTSIQVARGQFGPVGMGSPFTEGGRLGSELGADEVVGQAAAVAAPGLPVADVGKRQQGLISSIWNVIKAGLQKAGYVAVKNSLRYFAGQLAQSTAEWVAQGFKGQKPLFFTKNFGEYLRDAEDVAKVEFLDQLGQSFGIDVCEPSSPEVKLVLHYSLLRGRVAYKPRCTWTTLRQNWEQLASDPEAFYGNFAAGFEPENNDLGQWLQLSESIHLSEQRAKEQSLLRRLEGQGYRGVESLEGKVLTPATAVRDKVQNIIDKQTLAEESLVGEPLADFVGIFVGTLAQKLQEKWLKKGFVSLADLYGRAESGSGGMNALGYGQLLTRNTRARFTELASVSQSSANNVDVLSELASCTGVRRGGPLINECVIDDSFRQAIQKQLTIREALEEGLLSPEASFGFTGDLTGDQRTEPTYNEGYPYSSLMILRIKRILPVGWEMAALVAREWGQHYTLGRVVQCYEDASSPEDPTLPADCRLDTNGDGTPDINPLYHLVDPNWVLKVPETQCRRQGAGPDLSADTLVCDKDTNGDGYIDCQQDDSDGDAGRNYSTSSDPAADRDPNSRDQYTRVLQRFEYCADEQTCIAYDRSGRCLSYGYCYLEKPYWRFEAEQCEEQYAGCLTFTRPGGGSASYIRRSVEECSAGAAGCRWYSTGSSSGGATWSASTTTRLYLNGQAATCRAADAGCRSFLRLGEGVNLVPNGTFDDYVAHSDPSQPDDFYITQAGKAETAPEAVYGGSASLRVTAIPATISVPVETGEAVQGRQFTASVASRGCLGTVRFYNEDWSSSGAALNPATTTWAVRWISGTPASPLSNLTVELGNVRLAPGATDCWVDSLSLSEGSQAEVGAYGTGQAAYLNGQRRTCSPDDVGCQAYEPTSGDPTVYGRVASTDYCPSECVGYQRYTPLRNGFERAESPSSPLAMAAVNFIPSTARSCSSQWAGCSEFTNLDEAASGGERVAYFSSVRQCVADTNPAVGTYYTWEGSDTSGYQLRVWRLLPTSLTVLLPDGRPDQRPCTNLSLDGRQPAVCTDHEVSPAPSACSPSDPDCREVFDARAVGYLVPWSSVIYSSADCHPYRRGGSTVVYNIIPSQGRACPVAAVGCRQYRGPTAGNTRVALADDFEAGQVSGWGGGARLSSEALTVGGHSLFLPAPVSGAASLVRTEPIPVQAGKQYVVTLWAKGYMPAPLSQRGGLLPELGQLRFGRTANAQPVSPVSFTTTTAPIGDDWRLIRVGPISPTIDPGDDQTQLTFTLTLPIGAGRTGAYVDNVTVREVTADVYVVADSWTTPLSCDNPPGLPNGYPVGNRGEIGAMVGCAEYRRGGEVVTLRSFSRLCSTDSLGCKAFIDTANSASPFSQSFNETCSVANAVDEPTPCVTTDGYTRCIISIGQRSCTFTRTARLGQALLPTAEDAPVWAADRVAYLVDDPTTSCRPEALGCTALGAPQLNRQLTNGVGPLPAGSLQGWGATYRLVQPDRFGATLCRTSELWCSAFGIRDGGTLTMKDPELGASGGSATCEYRTDVTVSNGQTYTGWFRTGTTMGCADHDNNPSTVNVNDFRLRSSSEAYYQGYVGTCPDSRNSCTEYRDPAPNRTGGAQTSYYQLRSSVDTSSCNGQVDIEAGCLLFNDTSQASTFSSQASYDPARQGQSPVSAPGSNDANVLVKVRRDRTCAQWLTCGGSLTVTNPQGQQSKLCTFLAACNQLDESGRCSNYLSGGFPVGSVTSSPEFSYELGTLDVNRARNVSGYAFPGFRVGSRELRGYSPYSTMRQVGSAVAFANGELEDRLTDPLDDWDLALQQPHGWGGCSHPGSCTYTTNASEVWSGTSALKLSKDTGYALALAHEEVPVQGNTTYHLTAKVNTQSLRGTDPWGTPPAPSTFFFNLIERDAAGNKVCPIGCTLETPADPASNCIDDPADGVSTACSTGGWVSYVMQGRGQSWKTQIGAFTTRPNTVKVYPYLWLSETATGEVLLDEVAIEPVLQLNQQPVLADQECRIYPRSDSPSCDYDRPEGQFRGIRGYCVQRDPRDSRRCLQWWPVDMIGGQSIASFGGQVVNAGNPSPLYYCVQSPGAGGSPYRTISGVIPVFYGCNHSHQGTGGRYCDQHPSGYRYITVPANQQLYWWEMSYVRFHHFDYETFPDGVERAVSGEWPTPNIIPVGIQNPPAPDSSYSPNGYSAYYYLSQGNLVEFVLYFDSNGKFIAVRYHFQDNTGNISESVMYHLEVAKSEICSMVAQVATPVSDYGGLQSAYYRRFKDGWSAAEGNDLVVPKGNADFPYDAVKPSANEGIAAGAIPLLAGYYQRNDNAYDPGLPYSCLGGSCPSHNGLCSVAGQSCSFTNSTACWNAGGYCMGYKGANWSTAQGPLLEGQQRLASLFARTYKTYSPGPSGVYAEHLCPGNPLGTSNAYDSDPASAFYGCWDTRYAGGSNAPRVDELTLNGLSTGDAVVVDGTPLEDLRFTSDLNIEHWPLQHININWGDGNTEHFGPLSFADQPTLAAGHAFSHTYSYANLPNLCSAVGHPISGMPQAKCARVRVQVKDNWGWCNNEDGATNNFDVDQFHERCPGGWRESGAWVVIPSGTDRRNRFLIEADAAPLDSASMSL